MRDLRWRHVSVNPAREDILHLYRALLRESTYLPDPKARTFVWNRIVARFDAYDPHPTEWKSRLRTPELISQRLPELLKKGRKAFRALSRANHGHTTPLTNVLAMTYGRIGPRRHELLKDLKSKGGPQNPTKLEEVLQSLTNPANRGVPYLSAKFQTLLKSQHALPNTMMTFRKTLKRWELRIPETNSWGRPMPLRRVRNMKKKFYAKSLDRVMPPLPKAEWEHLRALAGGKVSIMAPLPRRREPEKPSIGSQNCPPASRICRPHQMTRRYMQRIYSRVFANCPLLVPDPTKPSGWTVWWGDANREMDVHINSAPRTTEMSIFQGVDHVGRLEGKQHHKKRRVVEEDE